MLRKVSNLTRIRKACYCKGLGVYTPSVPFDVLVPFFHPVSFSLGDVFSVSDLRVILGE